MPPFHTCTLICSSFGCRVGELPKFSLFELCPVGCQDSSFLASWPLWEVGDILATLVSTQTYWVPPTTAEDRDAQAHVSLR